MVIFHCYVAGKPQCVGLFSVSDVEHPCLEGQSREDRLEARRPIDFDRSTKINPKNKTAPDLLQISLEDFLEV